MPIFTELAQQADLPAPLWYLLCGGLVIPVCYSGWQLAQGARLRRPRVVVGWAVVLLLLSTIPLLALLVGPRAGGWGYPLAVLLAIASLWELWVMVRAALGRPTYGSQLLWDICAFSYNNSIGHSIPHQMMFADIVREVALAPGMRLLDAGCGAGYLERYLDSHDYAITVTAVDFSAKMLERAQTKCPGAPFTFQQVDLNAPLPFADHSFDVIVSVQVFFALPRPDFTLTEFKRVLAPGGRLCIVDPHPGSNMGRVAVANLQCIARRERGLRRVITLAEAIARLPFGIVVLLLNVVMDYWVAKGEYHFDSLDALRARIAAAGFTPITITTTLAQQDNLVVAE